VRRAAGEFEVAFDDGTTEVVQAWALWSFSPHLHILCGESQFTEIYRAGTANNFNVCGA
jgi:hypothetical protein